MHVYYSYLIPIPMQTDLPGGTLCASVFKLQLQRNRPRRRERAARLGVMVIDVEGT